MNTSTFDFFCCAPYLVRPRGDENEPLQARPGTVIHAKGMGTTHTLCGLDASAWTKLWEYKFPEAGPDLCDLCSLEVALVRALELKNQFRAL